MPKAFGANSVWSLWQPSVADRSFWISAPLPPPSQPERIFRVRGMLFPPVPIRAQSVWHTPSLQKVTRLAVGLYPMTAPGGFWPRIVGELSVPYPSLRLLSPCPVQNPPAHPAPAAPTRLSVPPAAPCRALQPGGVYPDTPSDSKSTCPARPPSRSRTANTRFRLCATPQPCAASRTRQARE